MKINVTVTNKEAKKEESKYPYYGIHKDVPNCIVNFVKENRGIALVNEVPHYKTTIGVWDEEDFTPIIGTITIEQE